MEIHRLDHVNIYLIEDGDGPLLYLGDIYLLDQHDEHLLRGKEKGMTVACVFTPPITGNEVHREDGSYAAADD